MHSHVDVVHYLIVDTLLLELASRRIELAVVWHVIALVFALNINVAYVCPRCVMSLFSIIPVLTIIHCRQLRCTRHLRFARFFETALSADKRESLRSVSGRCDYWTVVALIHEIGWRHVAVRVKIL